MLIYILRFCLLAYADFFPPFAPTSATQTITQYVHLECHIPTTLKHDIKFLKAQLQKANQQQPKMSFKAAVVAISNFGNH